jgi:hypothetical protein
MQSEKWLPVLKAINDGAQPQQVADAVGAAMPAVTAPRAAAGGAPAVPAAAAAPVVVQVYPQAVLGSVEDLRQWARRGVQEAIARGLVPASQAS